MSLLTKEQIQAADDLPYVDVKVPEWGGEVRIGTLTSAERDDYEFTVLNAQKDSKDERINNMRALLIVRCAKNADGSRMLTDADAEWLGAKGCAAMQRLFPPAMKLNKLTKADQEELAKN